MSDEQVGALGADDLTDGIYIGFWDAKELADAEKLGESGN